MEIDWAPHEESEEFFCVECQAHYPVKCLGRTCPGGSKVCLACQERATSRSEDLPDRNGLRACGRRKRYARAAAKYRKGKLPKWMYS